MIQKRKYENLFLNMYQPRKLDISCPDSSPHYLSGFATRVNNLYGLQGNPLQGKSWKQMNILFTTPYV